MGRGEAGEGLGPDDKSRNPAGRIERRAPLRLLFMLDLERALTCIGDGVVTDRVDDEDRRTREALGADGLHHPLL